MGVQGVTWTPVLAYGDSTDASLGFGYPAVPDTPLPVEPYAHFIDGVKQPGVFLGSENVTLWGSTTRIRPTRAGASTTRCGFSCREATARPQELR